jgi:SPP1 gp7 family putative phage head morphogenesis protein
VPFDPSSAASLAPGQRYDLAGIVRRAKNPRRKSIELRPTQPTQALASDLYTAAYKPIVDLVTASVPAILAAYASALPVRDAATFHDAATDGVQQQVDGLGDQLQRLVLTLAPSLRSWALRVERWQRGKFRGSILSATGVDVDTILMGTGTPQSVGEYVNWNAALMKDVGEQARQRISNAVFAAFQARQPASDLAAEIRDIVGMSRRRSLNIASDQLSKLSAALDRERQTEAGGRKFRWHHSLKKHPRAYHVSRNGKVYAWDDPEVSDDLPGHAPFCGCRAAMVIEWD